MGIRRFILGVRLMLALAAAPCIGQTAPTRPAPTTDEAKSDLVEYMSRHQKLKAEDADGRIELAKWCRDRQMWGQMGEAAREALALDDENRVAYQLLKLFDENVSLPTEPAAEEKLLDEMHTRYDRDFKVQYTRHFMMIYDTSKDFALSRGVALEKAYDSFMFYFNMKTLHPAFLDQHLVVLLFKDRDDYLSYAKKTEGADLGWSSGYYSQRTNRAAFYDDSTSVSVEKAEKGLDKLRDLLKELNTQIDAANVKGQKGLVNQLTVERNRVAQVLFNVNNRVDNAVGITNNVKTVHEAAHQLAFNTGIQKRLVAYPMWFSEGLACCFEVEDRNNNRGPSVLNWGRITVLKNALKDDKLVGLEKMITLSSPDKLDEDTLSIWYAQGWALFHYMYKFDRPGLEKYLLALKEQELLRDSTPEQRKKMFTDAFGPDLALFEKKFVTYVRELPFRPSVMTP